MSVTAPPRVWAAQTVVATPLGAVLLARTERGLGGAWFEAQKHHPGPLPASRRDDDPVLHRAARALQSYFQGQPMDTAVALDLHGTPFQQRVWQALREIPWGATTSYSAIAQALGQPQAVRAVGGAVGRNPVSLFVPCHRVVGRGGALTGYAGGLPRKRWLLEFESARAWPDGRHSP